MQDMFSSHAGVFQALDPQQNAENAMCTLGPGVLHVAKLFFAHLNVTG
jgi:hypothetical protein